MSTRSMVVWLLLLCGLAAIKGRAEDRYLNQGLSVNPPSALANIEAPMFPQRYFSIEDFGAVGDGRTANTAVFHRAIQACHGAGGGHVVVPAGAWLTGPIFLADSVDLHLQRGALLIFSRTFDDYPLVPATFEGVEQFRCASPINGVDLENIAITGEGIIDGSGDAWRPVKKFKMTSSQWQLLTSSGGVVNKERSIWWPTEAAMRGESHLAELAKIKDPFEMEDVLPIRDFLRPVMVRLVNCKNVLLDGPTFQNSPAWNIHPLLCENMIIRNITVRNPWFSQNGDGLDLESCRNVLVTHCNFDVGDDAICLKSGKDAAGRRRARPSENILIQDCTVYHGHGGFTIGSEMSGGVHNVWLTGCTFIGTDVGLRFKSMRGRGGLVSGIFIENVRMLDILNEAILFDLFYANDYPDSLGIDMPLVSEETPRFENILIKNITCLDAETAVLLNGLPEMPLRKIEMSGMNITSRRGVRCSYAEGLNLIDVHIIAEKLPVFSLNQSRDVVLKPASWDGGEGTWLQVEGAKSAKIRIIGSGTARWPVVLGKDVHPGAVAAE